MLSVIYFGPIAVAVVSGLLNSFGLGCVTSSTGVGLYAFILTGRLQGNNTIVPSMGNTYSRSLKCRLNSSTTILSAYLQSSNFCSTLGGFGLYLQGNLAYFQLARQCLCLLPQGNQAIHSVSRGNQRISNGNYNCVIIICVRVVGYIFKHISIKLRLVKANLCNLCRADNLYSKGNLITTVQGTLVICCDSICYISCSVRRNDPQAQ